MKKQLKVTVLMAVVALPRLGAQTQRTESVVRMDPALDAIVPPSATVEFLKDGFGFIDGVVWVPQGRSGYLLVSDIVANAIHKRMPDGTMSVFLDRPDWKTTPNRPENARFGANGIVLDPQGRVVYCAEADRAVLRLEKDGKSTILADRYEGRRLNSPNDLVFRKDGALYFTDPSGGGRFGTWDLKKELSYQGVFLLKDGKLDLVINDLSRPNGLALSPDERYLYVNDSNKLVIMRYEVLRNGRLANGRLFVDLSTGKAAGNPDAMRTDVKGNLYSSGPGGIWVISPVGRHLGTIVPPRTAPGFTFGDADAKTLYIAAGTTLARIRLDVEGMR